MIEKFLEDIGLNEKEIKIYLELLKVESNSVLDLSKKTGILRTSIYPILESLEEKNLISKIKTDKKVRFQADSPEKLETYIETQKIKLDEQSRLVNDILPQLKGLSRQTGEKPIVKIYDGREGILKANEESFGYEKNQTGETSYFIYPYDLIEKYFSQNEVRGASKIRLNKNIKSKAIYTYSKGERTPSENSDRIKIDENKYPIKCDVSIFKDRVRIHTLGKSLSSVLIKSQDIADTLRSLFEIAFDNLKKNKDK
ncbi:MAG: helix-turn-helix domain-containing protein [Candidatus Paceibacterota bacterium]|jgi:sugar-specific transcriptional regulator TrmB